MDHNERDAFKIYLILAELYNKISSKYLLYAISCELQILKTFSHCWPHLFQKHFKISGCGVRSCFYPCMPENKRPLASNVCWGQVCEEGLITL